MRRPLIVSCTQQKHGLNTLLYTSLMAMYPKRDWPFDIHFETSNKTGLSKAYNKFINPNIASMHDIVMFVHDDVWIDDMQLARKVNFAVKFKGYDIVGLAGTLNPKIQHPALWHIMGDRQDHRGYAGHLMQNGDKFMTGFGISPSRVAVVDGLFVAVNIDRALETGWKWNENYDFHHYDIASCLDANKKEMKIGVYPINVFHQSPGLKSLEDAAWSKNNETFLKEYA